MHRLHPLTETKAKKDHAQVAFRLSDDGLVTIVGTRRERIVYAIDVHDFSLIKHIPGHSTLTSHEVVILAYLSYLYMLRLAETRDMRRMTTVPRNVVTETRDNVFLSNDLVKYKIATLRCVIEDLKPQDYEAIEAHFVECGLNRTDATLYHLLYHNKDVDRFKKLMQEIEDATFTLEVDTLSKELDNDPDMFREFEKTANYHVHKKLRFIAHSNRFTYQDLIHDLVMRSIQAYYWVRPFYNKVHAMNYAKRTLMGYSNCIIDFYQAEERRRMVSTADGYDNVIRDLSEDIEQPDIYAVEAAMVEYLDMTREAYG